jgi:alkanesulfonate monooxygenase SsuD/methylene tetrahydromethanopterin reductase-like flavin-dependent oxidoreductase (luciferase family)
MPVHPGFDAAPPLLFTGGGGRAVIAESARLAEAAGFAGAWTTEFYDRSATVSLAAMAAATSTITLGSAIAYGFGRTPLVWAAEARDLDELTGKRLILGLGTGTRRMQQDWHGLDGEHPAPRMELAGEPSWVVSQFSSQLKHLPVRLHG